MKVNRPRVPIGLPIAAVICLALGLTAGPLIRSNFSEEELARNVLLSAVPFILVFIGILLTFISLIWLVASALNGQVSRQTYRIIEGVIIGGILLGIFGMFQPWVFALYKYGFLILLISTLLYILWSHVRPRGVREKELGAVSVGEIEQHSIEG